MVFITIVSCTKTQTIVEQPTAPKGILNIQISHEVDGKALIFDSMIYHNKANNFYSISRVNYYISNVKLWGNGNNNYLLFENSLMRSKLVRPLKSLIKYYNFFEIFVNSGVDLSKRLNIENINKFINFINH